MSLSAITPPRPIDGGHAWIDTHGWDDAHHPSWIAETDAGRRHLTVDQAISLTGDLQTVLGDHADALAWFRGMGDHTRAEAMLAELRAAGHGGITGWALWAEFEGEPIIPLDEAA